MASQKFPRIAKLYFNFYCLASAFSLEVPLPSLCKYTSYDGAPLVKVDGGYVRGCETETGIQHFTIPYAEPPLGDLRFRAPVPKKPWGGTLDGTEFPTMCPQFAGSLLDNFYFGDEDCLRLSVHVPNQNATQNTEPLPVMFWIYGGGFMIGMILFCFEIEF